MSAYLAIDLGTTGCRSIVFDKELDVLADAYREYGLITPQTGWAEQDADLWLELTLQTSKAAIAKSGLNAGQIRGVSISSQGITVVPVDKDLQPMRTALTWLDVRAAEQTAEIERDFGQRRIFQHTGKRIDPAYTLPKLLWLRDNQPEIFKGAYKFLMPMDFLLAKLTGRCVTDHSMASGTLMYDIKRCRWSEEILEKYGIPLSKLPELQWSGQSCGRLLPEMAEALGVSPDCAVGVGAQDQKCAALGAGLKDGVMTVSLGTAGAVEKYWNYPRTDGDNRIGWSGYVIPGAWVTEGVINTAGTCLRWLRDTMFAGVSYDVINKEAKAALGHDGALMFYPYMNGPSSPDNYMNAQGCFYGVSLSATRGDFALAVMEGVAFQLRILLEAMEAYGSANRIVLFGGGSKSELWRQLIADITGLDISAPGNVEAAGAGAAILAGAAAGDFEVKNAPCVKALGQYKPSERKQAYAEKYMRYRSIEYKLWR